MKKLAAVTIILFSICYIGEGLGHAVDLSNKVQLGGVANAAWPLGQQSITDKTDNVGVGLGGLIAYGINSHWSAGLSYDNLNLGRSFRIEPIMANAIYRMYADKGWTPNFQIGVGGVNGVTDSSYEHISTKAGLGLEFFVCPNLSLGPQVTYVLADVQSLSKQYAHVVTAGLLANFFFGDLESTKTQAQAAPPPSAAPVVREIAVMPELSTLGPSESVQLKSAESATGSPVVRWSIEPQLGSISPTGLYTAPASIALPEVVMVKATSIDDPSKSAVARVKLTPPEAAPKQVSIRMEILFDTNKTEIKPQYDGEVAKVAEFMRTYPHSKAEIDGHTDNVGSAQFNMAFSERRANAVRDYLISHDGITADRVTARGFGLTQPIASNDTAAGRAQNRRVVAVLTASEQ